MCIRDRKKYGTELLGVNRESIKKAEDREEFKKLMQEIGEPIPSSIIATSMEECYDFVKEEGFPVIIRPAYTLGGTGGGIAENMEQLEMLCYKGMENSAIGQIPVSYTHLDVYKRQELGYPHADLQIFC